MKLFWRAKKEPTIEKKLRRVGFAIESIVGSVLTKPLYAVHWKHSLVLVHIFNRFLCSSTAINEHTQTHTVSHHNCCRRQVKSPATTMATTTMLTVVNSKISRGATWGKRGKVKPGQGEHLFQPGGPRSFLMYATAIEPPRAEEPVSSTFSPHMEHLYSGTSQTFYLKTWMKLYNSFLSKKTKFQMKKFIINSKLIFKVFAINNCE